MKRSLSSLRLRLISLILLAIIPALGLTFYAFFEQRQEAIGRLKAQSLRFTQLIALDAQHFVEGARQLLFTLAQFPPVEDGDAVSCNRLFANLLKEHPQFANIGAVRVPDGTIFASAIPSKESVSASDRAWFKGALENRDFSVGNYEVDNITGKAIVKLGYPVIDRAGRIKAVIFGALDLAWFAQLPSQNPLGGGAVLTVVDNAGTILVRHPEHEKWVGKSMPEASTIQSLLNRGERNTEITLPDGSARFYTFSRLPFKGSKAFVSIEVPKKLAFAPIVKIFWGSLLILGLVTALALTGAWLLGDVLILRRIQSLLEATRRLASGDLSARSGIQHGRGEISELAEAFDQMAEAIKEREEHTRALSQENEIMARIGQIISSTLKIEEIYERFAEETRRLIPFDRISINAMDPEGEVATVAYIWGVEVPHRFQGQTYPVRGSATEMVLKKRKALIVQGDDENELAARFPLLIPSFQVGLRSKLIVPLLSRDQMVGSLFFHSTLANAYTEKHLKLAERVGLQIGGAIASARLFAQHERAEQELRKAHRALRVIYDCNHAITRASHELALLQEVCRIVTEVGGYRMAWIGYAEEDDEKTVRPVAQAGYEDGYIESAKITWAENERGFGAMGKAIRTGRPCVIKNIMTDPDCIPWRGEAARHGYASTIAVPLIGNDRAWGALAIYAAEPDAFDEEESRLLTELGNDLAYGIEMLRTQAKQREAEKALLDATHQWRITFDAIHDAVSLMDIDGNILRCNEAMAKLLDRPYREINGHRCYTLVHGTNEPIEQCPHVLMRTTRQREQQVLPLRDRWINVTVDPIIDEKGDLIGSVHIMSDITEKRQAEMRMASLEEQMRQAQKMEAIGRLAGAVAHDFNNLLTVIKGYSQLALFQLGEDAPGKESIKQIERASEKAANLIRQLLAFSRRQVMEAREVDINALLRDLEKMLRRLIGEDVELVMDLGNDLGRIKTDPGQFEQVIFNLAVNARDAMPKGGKLTIQTNQVEMGAGLDFKTSLLTPGRYVMLSVKDTGIGMPPDVQKRIFEPFFTTKERGKGTGLGLSTVYGIVKQSGGEIVVHSKPGQGTTFNIYFPRIDHESYNKEREEEKRVQEVPAGKETILVVEDNGEVRSLAARILKRQGYTVFEASQPAVALDLCERHGAVIDMVLTDVIMPGMNGREFAERVLAIRPEMKVLYMSGYPGDTIGEHGFLEKGLHFIPKPFTFETLARKVREVLDNPA